MYELLPENILYCDNHILAVKKLAGQLVQGDRTGDYTLLDASKAYIKKRYNKPGNVFLGLVHRLDRPVEGIVVFARTSKAAARLTEQIREHTFKKSYIACVAGKIPKQGNLEDYIDRIGSSSKISIEKGKFSELFYERIAYNNKVSLVEIDLKTGRHHQIRVQFSTRGHAIIGDKRYQSRYKFQQGSIALLANKVEFKHPTRDKVLKFNIHVNPNWKKYIHFDENIWRAL